MQIQLGCLSILFSALASASALPYMDMGNGFSLNARQTDTLDAGATQKLCNVQQIHSMDVVGCDCRPRIEKSATCPEQSCTDCSLKPTLKAVKSCTATCDDSQADCPGCGIYFHSLCECLKSSKCRTTAPVKPGAPAIWALLETRPGEDDLVTSTRPIGGILDMGKDVPFADAGWVFAQDHYAYKPKQKALALNSFRARTESQVHIHVCNRTDTLYKKLTDEPTNNKNSHSFVQLKEDPELHCIMLPNGGVIDKWTDLIDDFLKNSGFCKQQIGAGILEDHRNITWGCVTTATTGPMGKFCDPTKTP